MCGKVRLFARSAVTALTVEAEEDAPDSLLRLGIPFEKRVVAVHMQDGSTLMGLLTALHLHGRTLDLLNQPSRSFAIRTDDTVHHIAKAFVERIEEL